MLDQKKTKDRYININHNHKITLQKAPTFLLFLTVTRLTPGIGFMPSFNIALRLFFSLLLCFDLPLASPSCCPDNTESDEKGKKEKEKEEKM